MFDFFRIACGVNNISVGNTAENTKNIIEKMKEAEEKGADVVLFPELCITGYTCADLFFQESLLKGALSSLEEICSASEKMNITAIVGLPMLLQNAIFNCAAIVYKGEVMGIVPKTYIPSYGEYYEKRWFACAHMMKEKTIFSQKLGFSKNYEILCGNDIIFSVKGVKFGIEICEDLWAPIAPSSYLALDGAEVIFNLSASNDTISKHDYRKGLVSGHSASCICAYAYASAGFLESTTDLVFSGHSIIAENGTIIGENEHNIDSGYLLVRDVDLGKIRADRMKNTTMRDCKAQNIQNPMRVKTICGGESRADGEISFINTKPFVPQSKEERLNRCADIFELQIHGLAKRLLSTGSRPVVGVSGGLDSTLALLVCVQAMKLLGKPASDICAVTMPCFGTTDRTHTNSLKLMEALGVTSVEINIKEACLKHFEDIGQKEDNHDLTYENAQARERTQVLMDYAGKIGGMVIGTGDLSELALGWCTYNADHMSMYGVNAGVPKTLVRWMVDSVAQLNLFPESTLVLKDICDTPISPELLPPDENGDISQQTEDIVGPYILHDFFLYNMVRFGFSPSKIYHLAKKGFKDFSNTEILKWLKNFYRRFFSQQFKRSCLPDGMKIGSICLSPRGDWRMPSDASAALWLDEIEKIKS
ncbi:MAG: NAD(+) synthase [Clostridia bacterium]|nr:NAD(+) synthase [Clostridia bacterium]